MFYSDILMADVIEIRCLLAMSKALATVDNESSCEYSKRAAEAAELLGFTHPEAWPPYLILQEGRLLDAWHQGHSRAIEMH